MPFSKLSSAAEEKLQLRWPLFGIGASIVLLLVLTMGIQAVVNLSKTYEGVRAAADGRPVPHFDQRPAPDLDMANQWTSAIAPASFVLIPICRFITFFYAEVDVVSRRMRYASAGHVPPLLVSAGGALRELYSGGGALGAFAQMTFSEESTTLEPGDRIVCVTDAVTEARHGEEDYGDEHLRETLLAARSLPARDLLEAIIADVTAFCRGALQDDLTVLVIEVLPEEVQFARHAGS